MAGPAHLFNQTITYKVITGRDAYGKPTLGSASTARARVEAYRKAMVDGRGQEFVSEHRIFTAAALDLNYRVWVPGADTSDVEKARAVRRIEVHVDGRGVERYREAFL